MLGVHENILDFEIIETGNENTLVFVDSSQYMEEPDRPLLEITMPGYDKYFLVNYTARNVNVFNSGTLGINQVLFNNEYLPLPDGIWFIKQKICPYKYVYINKKHMRVTRLLNKVGQLYSNIDITECAEKNNNELHIELTRIHALIEGAKLVVNIDHKKAYNNYRLADRLVDGLLRKYCKNC